MTGQGSPPLDADEFERWSASAAQTLGAADDLAGLGHHGLACFQAEQAAQLCVKALLRGVGTPSFGHDLVDLAGRLAKAVVADLPDDMRTAMTRLSRHYVATRYPDAWTAGTPAQHYGAADSRGALDDAAVVLAAIRNAWEQLLVAGNEEGGDAR
ncbi:MAG: HEPN domain-containing protein [Actinomycetota bacterium]|nr:HEPN domain-containing protein [Actinomycetota bacterium]